SGGREITECQGQFAEFDGDVNPFGLPGRHFQGDGTPKISGTRSSSRLCVRSIDSQHANILGNRLADGTAGQWCTYQLAAAVFQEILGQNYVNAITRRHQASACATRGYRDRNRPRVGRQHDLEKFAVTRFDDVVATDWLARIEP